MANWDRKELAKRLEKRGIRAVCLESGREAREYILGCVEPGSRVCWAGSVTLRQIGLTDALKSGDYVVYEKTAAKSEEEEREIYSRYMLADYFFCSSNAITADGELLNVDGNGNRLSCLMYGPRKVMLVVGKNKYTETLEEAFERIRVIAPMNAKRGNYNTACLNTGRCVDCATEGRICCHYLVTRFNRLKDRMTVLLVNEDLGY